MTLPRLFSEKGALLDVDTSHFDAPTLARYDAIRAAYLANKSIEADFAAALSDVEDALEAVSNTEQYRDAHFKRETQFDLWKQNFAGGPRNRMSGRARI